MGRESIEKTKQEDNFWKEKSTFLTYLGNKKDNILK